MANPEHLAKLKEGPDTWNMWVRDHRDEVLDLSGADLSRAILTAAPVALPFSRLPALPFSLPTANLSGADLSGANLSDANLTYGQLMGIRVKLADLQRASLNSANLRGADFTGANLQNADLCASDLTGANLQGANLSGANLTSAHLGGANLADSNLSEAQIGQTTFGNNDLSTVKGLEAARHGGPSTIGIDTIFRSKGEIPEPFLRGCGVPDSFIAFAKSIVTNPIQFYSCFISYSTKDQAFADRLYADLQNKGVRCWFAPHDVQGGKKLHEQIDEAIRRYERLLLILSPNSMSSRWVKTEIRNARKREVAEKKRMLFPVRLASYEALRDWKCFDADTGKDSAREIREYFIPDFSNWKDHDSYQEAFQRLISDLKASDTKQN